MQRQCDFASIPAAGALHDLPTKRTVDRAIWQPDAHHFLDRLGGQNGQIQRRRGEIRRQPLPHFQGSPDKDP